MKTKKLLLMFSVIGLLASSCQDGDIGVSKFRVTCASGFLTGFSTSDANIPTPLTLNTFYTSREGTYSYIYDWDIYTFSGTYKIVQEPGESWDGISNGLLTQPASGLERKYTFDTDAPVGEELSYTKNLFQLHKDIIVDKTIFFDGGKLIIKGKGVYDPKHLLNPRKK